MTDATEKQINFAKTLGIENAETFSKQALRELIEQKVGQKTEQAKAGTLDTGNRGNGFKSAPKREFHLTPEQVRTNAFDLAIKLGYTKENVFSAAQMIENYLWNGA